MKGRFDLDPRAVVLVTAASAAGMVLGGGDGGEKAERAADEIAFHLRMSDRGYENVRTVSVGDKSAVDFTIPARGERFKRPMASSISIGPDGSTEDITIRFPSASVLSISTSEMDDAARAAADVLGTEERIEVYAESDADRIHRHAESSTLGGVEGPVDADGAEEIVETIDRGVGKFYRSL